VVLAVSAPVLWVPLVACVPLQPPEAVHAVAFIELQVSVDVAPTAMLAGEAVRVTVGNGVTVTVTEEAALVPPAPLQVSVKTVFAVSAGVAAVPLAA
jgi:hypothetical protein